MSPASLIGTVAGVGHIRPAPGTWGSLAALPLAWVIYSVGGPWLVLILIPVVFAAGVWATAALTQGAADHDPSEVVIDEVVGQWIALLPVLFGAARAEVSVLALWPGWIAAFLLFRGFDILKPGPIGWADKMETPLGVMLDDVIAGVFAAIGVGLLAAIYHVVLL